MFENIEYDPLSLGRQLCEYFRDSAQRTILYWDVMHRRGNQYLEHQEKKAPHVLQFDCELVVDGRTLPQPVNYGLVRIVAPEGVTIDERKRPFVIIDPRAGHGPGIGGFKAESEIGVAMQAGHPCYFVGFLPMPEPGQTIEDVMRAEAEFLERVIELHPKAEGKPVVIGNCQAGWAVMMLAAAYPDLCGPIILAGAPISYWDGVRGVNPMRYTGGLLGGSWLTALVGDLGNGKFDGAWLVQNFENLNPANTLWSKQYNLYAKIDTEMKRYLGFEKWWGGHVVLNAGEMQFIVDNLFVGNKLSTAEIVTGDGTRLDIRNIRSPIICFCSKGDNITPPQQALGWISDLYDDADDIRKTGQTIVYAVHERVGHLGIFVGGAIAKKEHREFAENIDFIDCLPPGLYEAVLEKKSDDTENIDLVSADYISRFEGRSLEDVKALGRISEEDERCFAAVKRLSEINLGLYRKLARPAVRAMATEESAEWMRRTHPLRLGYEIFSDRNPAMKNLEDAAEKVRDQRKPAAPDNIFLSFQNFVSEGIATSLDAFRQWSETMSEQVFFGIYQNPLLQAMLGLQASDAPARPAPGKDPQHVALVKRRIQELRDGMDKGGPREAVIRSIIYVRMPENAPDERAFAALNRIRKEHATDMPLSDLKRLMREQCSMLLIDESRALETIPALLKGHEENASQLLEAIRAVVTAKGQLSEPLKKRMARIEQYFAAE